MFIFSLWRVVGATCSDRKERGTAATAAARHILGLVVLCVTIMLTKYKRVKLTSAKQSTWLHAGSAVHAAPRIVPLYSAQAAEN